MPIAKIASIAITHRPRSLRLSASSIDDASSLLPDRLHVWEWVKCDPPYFLFPNRFHNFSIFGRWVISDTRSMGAVREMRTELAGAPRRSIPGVFRNRVVSCGGCYSPLADVDAGARRISLEGTGAIFAPVSIDQPITNADASAKTTSTKHRNAKNVDQCVRSLVCTASTGSRHS
jgi:hypothetical protein